MHQLDKKLMHCQYISISLMHCTSLVSLIYFFNTNLSLLSSNYTLYSAVDYSATSFICHKISIILRVAVCVKTIGCLMVIKVKIKLQVCIGTIQLLDLNQTFSLAFFVHIAIIPLGKHRDDSPFMIQDVKDDLSRRSQVKRENSEFLKKCRDARYIEAHLLSINLARTLLYFLKDTFIILKRNQSLINKAPLSELCIHPDFTNLFISTINQDPM